MPILLYGMDMARSIIEEKSSRIFEVMLAVARPDDLLAGKLLGVGAVGLTQIAIWMAAGDAVSGSAFAAPLLSGDFNIHFSLARRHSFPGLLCARLFSLQLVLLRPGRHLRNRAGPADVHAAGRHSHLDQLCRSCRSCSTIPTRRGWSPHRSFRPPRLS